MFQEKLYKKLKQGFTLVELLIVMGILAILSAMGFRYYTSNIVTSRDASRIQTLTSMHGQLQTLKLKEGAYPMPNSSVKLIGSGGITVGYQGVVGPQLLNKLTIIDGKPDGITGKYSTYIQNAPGQMAEVGTFFEESGNEQRLSILGIPEVSAANYSKLYLGAIGNPIGILVNRTTFEPLQETTSADTVIASLATANTHSIYGSCLVNGRTSLLSLGAAQSTSYLDCFRSIAPALPGGW